MPRKREQYGISIHVSKVVGFAWHSAPPRHMSCGFRSRSRGYVSPFTMIPSGAHEECKNLNATMSTKAAAVPLNFSFPFMYPPREVVIWLYGVLSRVWTVPSLCSWKFWKIQDNFDPDGQLELMGPPVRSNPTTRRASKLLLNFSKFSWTWGRNCPHSRWYTV